MRHRGGVEGSQHLDLAPHRLIAVRQLMHRRHPQDELLRSPLDQDHLVLGPAAEPGNRAEGAVAYSLLVEPSLDAPPVRR
jgi:hypothetical protein